MTISPCPNPNRPSPIRLDSAIDACLAGLETSGLRRRVGPLDPPQPLDPPGHLRRDGRLLLDLSSNDYLGLARHPLLAERAAAWAHRFGTGARASRLVSGTLEAHEAVETRIAALKQRQAALLFASGWQANATVLPALASLLDGAGETLVYTDRLVHASLHQGCRAAGWREIRFRHNDLDHLRTLLAARADRKGARLILTETVFSMDGDRADLAALRAIAAEFGAILYLDEAHATGVLGPAGAGLSTIGEPAPDEIVMGTASKALGGFGAYVAGTRRLRDLLLNRASGVIHTTALPPPVLGALDAALDLLPGLDAARAHLAGLADRLRAGLAALGHDTGASTTQIVPLAVGEADRALALAARLEAAGILAVAIRPPTVPPGTARLRLALSCVHGEADIDRLLEVLA